MLVLEGFTVVGGEATILLRDFLSGVEISLRSN